MITDVLGPGWTQDISVKKHLMVFTHEATSLRISLVFDKKWKSFMMEHDYPKNRKVNMDYMNELEYFYYALYIITSSQRPFREWVEEVINQYESLGEPL